MKVGIVVHNDIDVDVRVSNQWNILTKAKIESCILCTGKAKPNDKNHCLQRVDTSGIKHKFYHISSSTNSLFYTFWKQKIKAFFSKNQVDLLHVHDLFMASPAAEAAKELKVPVVLDLHENYPEAFQKYSWTKKLPHRLFVNHKYWVELEKTILKKVDGLIALDEAFVEQLKEKLNVKKTSFKYAIYPNVPDLKQLDSNSEVASKDDDIFRIFYFGIISIPRYLHIAKKAIDIVNESGRKAKLVAAGNIIESDRQFIEQHVLGKNTEHIPWINLEDLGQFIAKMDVCISPIEKNAQHESGIANKVFQYMYFSKPLLVSNCIPQARLVESTQCGFSYTYDDPRQLAEKIIWLIENPKKSIEMGKNGKAAILQKYNIDVFGKRILELYESVLSKNSDNS